MSLFRHPRMRMSTTGLKKVKILVQDMYLSCKHENIIYKIEPFLFKLLMVHLGVLSLMAKLTKPVLSEQVLTCSRWTLGAPANNFRQKKQASTFIYRHPHPHLFHCGCEILLRISADADVSYITSNV